MKKELWVCAAIGLLLSGCSQSVDKQELSLDKFTLSDGSYGFADLPFGQSQSDIEEQLSITFNNSQQTAENIVLCALPDYYQYDGQPVRLSLEFNQDALRTLMFTISSDDAADEIYHDVADSLTELYGQPTETIENDGSQQNGIAGKGIRWDSTSGTSTSLQVILMSGDQIEPSVSIGVGLLE